MAKEKLERFNASQASLMTKAARLSNVLPYRAEYLKVIEKIKEIASQGINALLIDDGEYLQEAIVEMLQDDGYQVNTFYDDEFQTIEYTISWKSLTTKE